MFFASFNLCEQYKVLLVVKEAAIVIIRITYILLFVSSLEGNTNNEQQRVYVCFTPRRNLKQCT